jgi:hypothetical protein
MSKTLRVIVEFRRVGAYVKVSALDEDSLTEVSIVGDAKSPEAALRDTALRKLVRALERRGAAPSGVRG